MDNKTNKDSQDDGKKGGKYIFRKANIPKPVESVSKIGSLEWGKENLYPQFLFKNYYESPIHGGIINSKVTYIVSGGLEYTGPSQEEFDNIVNSKKDGFSLMDIQTLVCRDNEVTNAFVYYFKRNRMADRWVLKPMDIELIRKTESENLFHYSEDWGASTQNEEKTAFRVIKSIYAIEDEDNECLIYVTNRAKQYNYDKKKLTNNYYPIPVYSGAISSIMADEEMNFFHYSEVINSFKGGSLISLNNGEPDSEEKENKIVNEIKGSATDRNTQGGLAVVFSDGKERAPTIQQINGNNLDSRYLLTQEHLRDSIMVAHSVVTPVLFGVKQAGQLGNTQELLTGFLIFKDNYAKARQMQLIEPLNHALQVLNDFKGEIGYNEYIPEYLGGVKESATGGGTDVGGEEVADVAGTAMNGAQIASMVAVVEAVGLGTLTAESAVEVILASFPNINREQAGKIVGLGDAFVIMYGHYAKKEQSQTDTILDEFNGCGLDRGSVTFIQSRELTQFDSLEDNELEFVSNYIKEAFANGITKNQGTILQMVANGEAYAAIKEATGQTAVDLTKDIIKLKAKGLIDRENWEVTTSGLRAIADEQKLRVVYSYEERPNAPALKPGGESRPFCKTLLAFNRVYTRDEINTITTNVGRDVWLFRGGWYHDPNTDSNQPSCRHFWKQNIIIEN